VLQKLTSPKKRYLLARHMQCLLMKLLLLKVSLKFLYFDNTFSFLYCYYNSLFIIVSSQSEISENEENLSRKHTQHNTHTENNTHTSNTHPEPHTSSGSKGRADFYYSHGQSVFTKDKCSDNIVNSDIKIDSDNSESEDTVNCDSDKEEIIEDVGHDLGVDNNTKPHTCDICEKSFVKESNLLDHRDTQHSYFSCRVRVPVFHAFFKQKAKLKKHYEIKHDRYCPYCYVYFSKYDELEQHVLGTCCG
jgi:Ca2+/Na+ antiporter